jgi:hypothetical protein
MKQMNFMFRLGSLPRYLIVYMYVLKNLKNNILDKGYPTWVSPKWKKLILFRVEWGFLFNLLFLFWIES